MAFTTPATQTAATVLTAAWLNTYVRDNIAWIATDSPAARAYKTTDFTHNSSGNWLAITFNSERFDNAAVHDTGSNTDRFTVPSGGGGKYLIGCTARFAASASGAARGFGFMVNATTIIGENLAPGASATAPYGTTQMTVYSLSAADYVTVRGYQDTGGSLAVSALGNYTPEGFVFWFRT